MPPDRITLVERLRQERRQAKRASRVAAIKRPSVSSDDIAAVVGVDILVLDVGGASYRFDTRAELSITASDVDKTLDSHAERLAFWGNLAESVRYDIAVLEIDLDDIRKSRYLAYRTAHRDATKRAMREGGKLDKWTDREITAAIDTEPEVLQARKTIALKKQGLGYCLSMVRAFTQRGKMIMKWGKMPEHADDTLDT